MAGGRDERVYPKVGVEEYMLNTNLVVKSVQKIIRGEMIFVIHK